MADKLKHSKTFRPYHKPTFGPYGLPESGEISVSTRTKSGKAQTVFSFTAGSGRKWHLELALHPADFSVVIRSMFEADRTKALEAFATAILQK